MADGSLGNREIDMYLNTKQLSALFIENDWPHEIYPFVTPPVIGLALAKLLSYMENGGGARYAECGRLLIWRDSDLPGSFELALKIGHVSYYPDDMDTPVDEPPAINSGATETEDNNS